ncbi:hypothetical protein [Teredinibacter sp. KSP-S5-2]|uniref:hypothetical protein n=1 Tax=Teredinibacter sp. KSP-S5-2 TaxID=3034506 RepID=UPI002935294A|nr:hypothetical protein [Teredinibacter sp. KSP-S5-2]WNO11564.1 hypothetical protein P5V12_10310 [Teredinibacter sp. KSP-S5-2]
MTKIFRFIRKVFVPTFLGLMLVVVVAHNVWKSSGSNEWELQVEEDGISVYSLKTPGETLLKFRAVMDVETSLSSATFLLRGDESTADDFEGEDFTVHSRYENEDVYLAFYSVKHIMPEPIGTKEIVMMLNYSQDQETKEVVINVQAAPTYIPPTEGVERVRQLNNRFRLTPKDNGVIEWEIVMDVDMGIPYPMFNMAMTDAVLKDLKFTRELVKTEKYQNAKLVSVKNIDEFVSSL